MRYWREADPRKELADAATGGPVSLGSTGSIEVSVGVDHK